ncbi:hypothetical protein [Oceaniglobus indicus]|uniref:hypothetical protein n=1 Tax=Oceaniglobus indicus TaxID=2047749 RepID=UPI000C186192|nr:hypothetical protein [Oceaniglobus indicus]
MPSAPVLVGDANDLQTALPLVSDLGVAPEVVDILDVDATLKHGTGPGIVVSLAISDGFDCFDVAQILTFNKFCGRYRIVPVGLPKPEILVSEARKQFPDLDIDLLSKTALPQYS